MGERLKNWTGNWSEGYLDWDSILGADFETAPDDWISVWRECSSDELVRAAGNGLSIPLPEMQPPEVRRENGLLDGFRPDSVVRQGVSRLFSISASPSPEDVPHLPHRRDRELVEMLVDPKDAFVVDSDLLVGLYRSPESLKIKLENVHDSFRQYWDSMIPLPDFLDRYERLEMADGGHWVVKDATAAGSLPKAYSSPEVLIKTHTISGRHIRLG